MWEIVSQGLISMSTWTEPEASPHLVQKC
uniref:Uncharacterized protein n=1 Tax=Arundo donax TaxID=35708 RepID=A0A0A9AW88_ARUDO